jgi:hypothetical protein
MTMRQCDDMTIWSWALAEHVDAHIHLAVAGLTGRVKTDSLCAAAATATNTAMLLEGSFSGTIDRPWCDTNTTAVATHWPWQCCLDRPVAGLMH